MKRLHIIGHKGHGKTRLIVDLLREFTMRGMCVGAIKHTHHRHEFDTPGKDSYEHRMAGASPVGLVSSSMCAVFWPSTGQESEERYDAFGPLFTRCDFVLVEGDSQTLAPKIEVWRSSQGTRQIADEDSSVLAIVTDDELEIERPTLRRSDVPALADWILHVLSVRAAQS